MATKKGRKPTDRDRVPHMAVWGEVGDLEELHCKGERIVIPKGQHKKDGGHEEGDTYPLANPRLA